MRLSRNWILAAVLASAIVALASSSQAAPPTPASAPTPSATSPRARTGRIVGRASTAKGVPLEFASIGVVGTSNGTITDEQGRYVLAGVPAGEVKVQLQAFGTPVTRTVQVTPGGTVTLDITTDRKIVVFDEILVVESKIDTKSSESDHKISEKQLQEMMVDDPLKAAGLQTGIVAKGGELFVHGGRQDEVKVTINGVEAVDPQTLRNANVATLAVSELNVITGGFDAEHGGALSGIIEISTREGDDTLRSQVRWDTDRFGDPSKTFDNLDRFTIASGGPTPMRHLTWFGAYEGTFTDTYLPTTVTRPSRTLFDFIRVGNRQSNVVNTNLKLAYEPVSSQKVTLEVIDNRSVQSPYEHMWSRQGFVRMILDSTRRDGRTIVTPRFGGWSATRRDDRDVYVNLPDHVPQVDNRFRQIIGAWTHQLSSNTVLSSRISSAEFRTLAAVARKSPWEYWVQSPFYWNGNVENGTENNPYFATHGDFPRYARRRAGTYTMKSDLATRHWEHHRAKAGFEAKYNRVENLSLTLPNEEVNGLPGGNRSEFVNFNPEGSAYVQDRWEYEGMVLNAGLRYDVFTPGDQITDQELVSGRRYKRQVSPRLGIAYPISDRDVLSFHYGWTYQTPARGAIFENRGQNATVNTRGNPDLEPETNVAYQAAMQHLFSRDVSGQFSVFFRDIYGLITTRRERDDFGNLINVFHNGDYASSRGCEASVSKSFSHRFSADLHYTYSIATGVASDPNQALQFLNGGRLFLPISERALNWDQRHTVSFSSMLRDPGRWGMRMLWTWGSGFPYTPSFRNDRRQDPKFENSQRLPSNFELTLDADKFYRVWGQDVTLFVQARNLLDAVNIADVSPNNGGFPNPFINPGGQDDYLVYYTETGRAGGAYLQDTNGDHELDWVPVHDPRVFEEGRNVRMGVSLQF